MIPEVEESKTNSEVKAESHHDWADSASAPLPMQNHLNRNYTFETFVNGRGTQFVLPSLQSAADESGTCHNAIFLFGGTGSGKTHLLHAIGNRVLSSRPDALVIYVTSERFMNEMIYCLRFNKMWDFRRKYRTCDVLLVDDIQDISGRERTQVEFLHTFEVLYGARRQIVITSSMAAGDIPGIDDRLKNRLDCGFSLRIESPDFDHRVSIVSNRAEMHGIQLNQEIAEHLASVAKGNVRAMEGALKKIIMFAAIQGRPIDINLAHEVLQDVYSKDLKDCYSIEEIKK